MGHALSSGRTTRLFFLHGTLTPTEADQIASQLLADPVVDTYTITALEHDATLPSDQTMVEVTLQPGVTDPAAENLVRAAHRLGYPGLLQAATGQRYTLPDAALASDTLASIANTVFANPVIQRTSLNTSITPPFITPQVGDGLVEMIAIAESEDDQLLAISKTRRLSLDLAEMQAIRAYYEREGREATDIELEMLAQTWSEHCVHKTFRATIDFTGPDGQTEQINGLLKTYIRAATETVNKPWVRSAFVDNAGIIAFDEDFDLAFKVETHNHPSALEPFGGANTGVGGVVRDILGVSARPIANTDVLLFGEPDMPDEDVPQGVLHPRRIAEGVIHGVEDYGNKMGIPTVGGAIFYDKRYTANPLVFCGCVGIIPRGTHRTEAHAGDLIVVIGGRTGRDGLRGATFSSMEMDTSTSEIASISVQIGHPIQEKQVQEVILRTRDEGLYTAITDCGAGGLSSAVGEMGKDLGAQVELTTVPLKYPGLRPWEIWLSEAQERMVIAVHPDNWVRVQEIATGQDVEAVCIGTYTNTGRLELTYEGTQVGSLQMHFLHDGIPTRHLKAVWNKPSEARAQHARPLQTPDFTETLLALLAHPNIRSKEAVIRRYDHEVQGGTVVKPLVGTKSHGPGDGSVIVPLDTKHQPQPLTLNPSPTRGEGLQNPASPEEEAALIHLDISPAMQARMVEIVRHLRSRSTPSEEILWQELRSRKLGRRKFRRQQPVGAFVLDFYCAEERLAVEVDGSIHLDQQEADRLRQELLEELGIRFVRVSADEVEKNIPSVLSAIQTAFHAPQSLSSTPSPLVGEGFRVRGAEAVRGFALGHGLCPQYTELDPYAMAWAAVDEAFRNVVAVGADPDQVAILDNFCWGNPNMSDRLGSLVLASKGCHDAAVAYGAPFISGKDSLNNEYTDSDGTRHAIPGTLLISAIAAVPDVTKTVTMDLKQVGNFLYVIGETRPEMGGSHYNRIQSLTDGTVPQPNPESLKVMRALHKAIQTGLIQSCHDVSEGGIVVALAEMCIAGELGAFGDVWDFLAENGLPVKKSDLDSTDDGQLISMNLPYIFFSETTGRFIVEVRNEDEEILVNFLKAEGVAYIGIGKVSNEPFLEFGSDFQQTDDLFKIPLADLERAFRGDLMDAEPLPIQPTQATASAKRRTVTTQLSAPKALILHANGTNRDRDAALACEVAGAVPEIVHMNQLANSERRIGDYDILIVPGGFSYGDDLGAGMLWALDLRQRFREDLQAFVQAGKPVLGICNGFQTLVKAGLLPTSDFASGPDRRVTLTNNEVGHFECRPVYLQPQANSTSLFTQGLSDLILCPVAHGEGRVVARDEAMMADLIAEGLVPLTYVNESGATVAYPGNPNGSSLSIAALCNAQGNVMGLMPHPEDHIFPWQHPRYHRGERGQLGLVIFQNAAKYA